MKPKNRADRRFASSISAAIDWADRMSTLGELDEVAVAAPVGAAHAGSKGNHSRHRLDEIPARVALFEIDGLGLLASRMPRLAAHGQNQVRDLRQVLPSRLALPHPLENAE